MAKQNTATGEPTPETSGALGQENANTQEAQAKEVPEHWEGKADGQQPETAPDSQAEGEEVAVATQTNALFFHEGIRIFSEPISPTTGIGEAVALECLGRAMDTIQHGHGLPCKLVDATNALNPFGEPFIELPERFSYEQLVDMLPQYEWENYDSDLQAFDFEKRVKRLNDQEARNVRANFTQEEVGEIAQAMAQQNLQFIMLEEEKKEAVADYGARLKALKGEINMRANLIRQGYDFKNFQCFKVLDFAKGKVYYQDSTTGKYIDVRDMLPSERQIPLPLPEGEAPVEGEENRELPFGESSEEAAPENTESPFAEHIKNERQLDNEERPKGPDEGGEPGNDSREANMEP